MLEKKGKTPKSYAENLRNDEGELYFCSNCDKVIREGMHDAEKCPFCGSVGIELCEIHILKISETLDGESQNKHP